MNDKKNILDYYKPENFYTNNTAYAKYKDKFDHGLRAFQESEEIKDKIKIYYNQEQLTSMLIVADAQNLFMAILKICNEGLADVAGILLRSIFEDNIQLRYIKKHKLGDKFNNYFWISLKKYYDHAEKYIPKSELRNNKEYLDRKEFINKQFEKYKENYTKKIRKWNNIKSWFKPQKVVLNKWSKKSLFKMATNLGEKETYNTIMPYHSKFVHCDPHGLANFLQGNENSRIIDNSASLREIDLVLYVSTEIFCKIAIEMAASFEIEIPEFFKKYIKK